MTTEPESNTDGGVMPLAVGDKTRTAVQGLGEIALRVCNLDLMQKFYEEAIGLTLIARHWRSIYVHDPNGNKVELVCYDGSVG